MLDPHVVFIGAAIGLSGTLLYARDTLRGTTQPNRVTWLLWTIAPMLAFADELRQGVGLQSVMTFTIGFGPLVVLLASFANKSAVWKIGPFDIACGIASVGGIALWLATSNNTVALASFMAADAMAGLPDAGQVLEGPGDRVGQHLPDLANQRAADPGDGERLVERGGGLPHPDRHLQHRAHRPDRRPARPPTAP